MYYDLSITIRFAPRKEPACLHNKAPGRSKSIGVPMELHHDNKAQKASSMHGNASPAQQGQSAELESWCLQRTSPPQSSTTGIFRGWENLICTTRPLCRARVLVPTWAYTIPTKYQKHLRSMGTPYLHNKTPRQSRRIGVLMTSHHLPRNSPRRLSDRRPPSAHRRS